MFWQFWVCTCLIEILAVRALHILLKLQICSVMVCIYIYIYFFLFIEIPVNKYCLQKDNRASLTMSEAQSDYCHKKDFDPEDPRCARILITGEIMKVRNVFFIFLLFYYIL